MYKIDYLYLNKNSSLTIFTLFFIAIFAIGGCSDGGGGGDVNGSDTSACTALSDPCSTITEFQNDSPPFVECVLSDTPCAVDLDNVLSQLRSRSLNVSDSSILYIGAWGGNGGSAAENGGGSSIGGYTQTTTSVKDIVSMGKGSSTLYYFLGEHGGNAPGHCGGGGGASTIVTFEDLTLNPGAEPTLDLLLMIAGGGGGAGGGTIKGCTITDGPGGARGGITIAPESGAQDFFFNAGAGCNGTKNGCGSSNCGNQCGAIADGSIFTAEGGGGDKDANGGLRMCCIDTQMGSGNGVSGIGGFGGDGGQGVNCTAVKAVGFRNASLSFGTGKGGFGGGGSKKCNNGGGGGGGGVGGGGGGGHGNDDWNSQSGGGGGSAAMSSTQDTSNSPTTMPTNPCGTSGCVQITIFED